jgi:hypothetical protein
MRKHRFIIYRQDKITPRNFVIITAETPDDVDTEAKLLDLIREGVERYVKATDEGKALYNYAGDDMNVGDLADHASDLVAYCEKIQSLSFESIDAAQDWTYDTSLCGEIEDITAPNGEA